MKTQYRITKKNEYFGWTYKIQRKILGIWWNIADQAYNEFDLEMTQIKLDDIIRRKKEFAERKKAGNSVIIKL